MSGIRNAWQRLGQRFDAYSRRERALLATALIGGSILLGNIALIDPSLARARQAERQTAQEQSEAKALAAQAGTVKALLQADPDAGTKAEIAQRQTELASVEAALKALEGDFVPPAEMNALLENLLSSHARLRLLSLKSLAPVNLAAAGTSSKTATGAAAITPAPTPADGAAPLGLYKHGVEVRIEGSYADLHAWLAQVEASPQRLLWGDVQLTVVEHPTSLLTLTLYTLSTDRAGLAI